VTESSPAPRTGRVARSAIAGVAVARVGMAQLGHTAKSLARPEAQTALTTAEHEAKLGRILFSALNQLKGTALKASQLLSMELGFLPEGVRTELAKAHYQATPLNRALVIKLLRESFGKSPHDLFATFDPQAFAAASLGQVHAASTHSGQAVAVKLQYPGMAASVSSDLQLLRGLLTAFAKSTHSLPKAHMIEQVLADIELKLAEELDYEHEASQLIWFGQHLNSDRIVVPQPVLALSSKRVLTLEHLPGQHLNEWLQTLPSQAQRNQFGQLLFDTFLRCTFELGRLQADPHPGNYLFMPDGRLGLLDFGCTRALDAAFVQSIRAAWSALLRNPVDHVALRAAYLRLGMIAPDLSATDFVDKLMPSLADLQHWQRLPFSAAFYDFSEHPPLPTMQSPMQRQAIAHMQNVPPDLPYFDRSYMGLVQVLKALGAEVQTANPWINPRYF
jgi:predicted unusual protein kinase regulating ubiquinone biosynthesis (AarF/ABC1/UbiB family)